MGIYTAHFRFTEPPFTIAPDPRFLYMSDRHREALAHLLYGVGEGGGFVQLTGEVGTGKTTLSRCLLEQIPPDVDVALILNPRLTSFELLATVCDELRIAYPPDTTGLKALMDALYRHLLETRARGRRTVLIVDEAQDLAPDVLEQVRLLTNLETTREKLLQVILLGQPELNRLLQREDLRQVAQRVTARYHLEPFSEADTRHYVRHRLQVAGRARGVFTDGAIRRVHAEARGIPRLINVICDRALLGAFVREQSVVDARTVADAAAEVRGEGRRGRPRWWRWAGAAAVLALLAGAGLLLSRELPARRPEAPVAAAPPVVREARAATPAPGAAVTRPAPVAQPPVPLRLETVLADPDFPADEPNAFRSLYVRWGLLPSALEGRQGCEAARAEGLRCAYKAGNWAAIRQYNLPVILGLVGATGARHWATLTRLGDRTATLVFGGHDLAFPLDEVQAAWDGSFVLVWRAPQLQRLPIAPGARGRDVEWLHRQLAAIEGREVAGAEPPVYDGSLAARVMAFQRSRSLEPDGVVGEETLAHLVSARADAELPLLSPRVP